MDSEEKLNGLMLASALGGLLVGLGASTISISTMMLAAGESYLGKQDVYSFLGLGGLLFSAGLITLCATLTKKHDMQEELVG